MIEISKQYEAEKLYEKLMRYKKVKLFICPMIKLLVIKMFSFSKNYKKKFNQRIRLEKG